MEGEQLIRVWLDAVDAVSEDRYVGVGGYRDLPERVHADSSMWCERFFAEAANPHSQTPAPALRCHLATETTPDLLRHEYTFQGIALDVCESINFALIRVGGNPPTDFMGVAGIAQRILNLTDDEHKWLFQPPDTLSEGAWFSTAPNADPYAMGGWGARADGGIHKGRLYFLCFKKEPQRKGYRDIQGWYGPEFRPPAR